MQKIMRFEQNGKYGYKFVSIPLPEEWDTVCETKVVIRPIYDMTDFNEAVQKSNWQYNKFYQMLQVLWSAGLKIEAIKLLREVTNWGLLETKNFLESNIQIDWKEGNDAFFPFKLKKLFVFVNVITI